MGTRRACAGTDESRIRFSEWKRSRADSLAANVAGRTRMQSLPDEGWAHQSKQRATRSAAQYACSRQATSTAAAAPPSDSTNVMQASACPSTRTPEPCACSTPAPLRSFPGQSRHRPSPDIRTLRPEEQGQRVCERHSRWQYSTRPWQFLAAGGNERGGSNPGGGLCGCLERPRFECPRFVHQVWDAEALGR